MQNHEGFDVISNHFTSFVPFLLYWTHLHLLLPYYHKYILYNVICFNDK